MFRMFKVAEPSAEEVRSSLTNFLINFNRYIRDEGESLRVNEYMIPSVIDKRIIRNLLEAANVPINYYDKYKRTDWRYDWVINLTRNSFIDKLEEGFAKKFPEYYREHAELAPPPYSKEAPALAPSYSQVSLI